ncbi:hypothetical protein [Nocardioides sp. 1609]|uniref:hypothetical protein n=1 Tax=Nocardioides sp. 1609 TaxID=2508327 RepID=UPI00106FFDC5|nr:hypothetical protein [Nocardioides sp. 1609]
MSYEVYDGDAPATGEVLWQVLVEYSNRGDAKPSTVVEVFRERYRDVESADEAALEIARTYDPPDPWSPQGRTVFREAAGYLTVVRGATKSFHFSTRVVQEV